MSDYVSRQYLLDEYDRQHQGPPGGARKIIAEAPAEDVAPVVHGKWIEEWWHGEKTRRCSICNLTQTVNVYKGEVKFKYCPYCGAKMRGEQE